MGYSHVTRPNTAFTSTSRSRLVHFDLVKQQATGSSVSGDMEDHFGMSILLDATLGPHSQGRPVPSPEASAPGVHQCRICKRSYERADHLNRHLKSHENARPFHCLHCTKRFNRADLLSRHLATHERQSNKDPDRPVIKRTDRAAEACVGCAASKSKCEDQKPCRRCRTKNIPCETPSSSVEGQTRGAKGSHSKARRQDSMSGQASQTHGLINPNDTNHISSVLFESPGASRIGGVLFPSSNQEFRGTSVALAGEPHDTFIANYEISSESLFASGGKDKSSFNDMNDMPFMPNMSGFDQDLDFGFWDFNFDGFQLPSMEFQTDIVPTQNYTPSIQGPTTKITTDLSRRYAAFIRSPWLWTPDANDNHLLDSGHLALDQVSITPGLTPSSTGSLSVDTLTENPYVDTDLRDKMFAIVLKFTMHTVDNGVPNFPSLDILNHVLHFFFVRQSYQTDHWIHAPTFSAAKAPPHLVMALITIGSTFISVPAIWKMGLALQEVVRISVGYQFDANNKNSRNLEFLQAFMSCLDVGLWSGFKRKMEYSESFDQPLITMLRRGGVFTAPQDSELLIPEQAESGDRLDKKWRKWVERESFKRLAIHLFLHGTHVSAALQKPPPLLLSELNFSMPASRELWLADTSVKWKQKYLGKRLSRGSVPRLIDAIHDPSLFDTWRDQIDANLSGLAALHGYWSQIWSLHEGTKFHLSSQTNNRSATHRLLLTAQYRELYQDIQGFAKRISNLTKQPSGIFVIVDFFMMTLQISPDELQRFAGKLGEEEASRAQASLHEWIQTPEARNAVWHAGQVFRAAKSMPPTELRDFHAIAVYFASLTLWAYGLILNFNNVHEIHSQNPQSQLNENRDISISVSLDGPETRETRMFLSLDQGIPGLNYNYEGEKIFEPLSNPNMVFKIAQQIYRDNFPSLKEPLPPLVENLGNLMKDLGSLPPSRFSRNGSENVEKEHMHDGTR